MADAAVKLEAQIKAEAGQITKNAATLRREADAAFARNDFRIGLQLLGQIAVMAPADAQGATDSVVVRLQSEPDGF